MAEGHERNWGQWLTQLEFVVCDCQSQRSCFPEDLCRLVDLRNVVLIVQPLPMPSGLVIL